NEPAHTASLVFQSVRANATGLLAQPEDRAGTNTVADHLPDRRDHRAQMWLHRCGQFSKAFRSHLRHDAKRLPAEISASHRPQDVVRRITLTIDGWSGRSVTSA